MSVPVPLLFFLEKLNFLGHVSLRSLCPRSCIGVSGSLMFASFPERLSLKDTLFLMSLFFIPDVFSVAVALFKVEAIAEILGSPSFPLLNPQIVARDFSLVPAFFRRP